MFKKYAPWVIAAVAIGIAAFLWFYRMPNTDKPTTDPNKLINATASVTVAPKRSPTDNDVEISQIYRASVNGAAIAIPITTKEQIKGVIKQEIDLTSVTAMQKELDKKEFKKNTEVGIGLGVHEGDVYIPVEIQRNYKASRAWSAEIHIDPQGLKVNGGELKHKWMF